MTQAFSLRSPSMLDIAAPEGGASRGGDQAWYGDPWQQKAGCGPVAASNLVWYLARTRPELAGLCRVGAAAQADFLALMADMFTYITPGPGGVHSSALFIPGLEAYCRARGLPLAADSLEVPKKPRSGPDAQRLRAYIAESLGRDLPVAFLNLSNGALSLPDSWHWVTVVALAEDGLLATISDEGRTYQADLGLWLETSLLGGALVTLRDR